MFKVSPRPKESDVERDPSPSLAAAFLPSRREFLSIAATAIATACSPVGGGQFLSSQYAPGETPSKSKELGGQQALIALQKKVERAYQDARVLTMTGEINLEVPEGREPPPAAKPIPFHVVMTDQGKVLLKVFKNAESNPIAIIMCDGENVREIDLFHRIYTEYPAPAPGGTDDTRIDISDAFGGNFSFCLTGNLMQSWALGQRQVLQWAMSRVMADDPIAKSYAPNGDLAPLRNDIAKGIDYLQANWRFLPGWKDYISDYLPGIDWQKPFSRGRFVYSEQMIDGYLCRRVITGNKTYAFDTQTSLLVARKDHIQDGYTARSWNYRPRVSDEPVPDAWFSAVPPGLTKVSFVHIDGQWVRQDQGQTAGSSSDPGE